MKEQLKVDPIKNGTVIDHITAGKALQVVDLLNLNNSPNELMIGMNLTSKKMGKKDIIKIEERELTDEEVSTIALISPTATTIIINNYVVVKKAVTKIPSFIEGLIVCPNPKCVTNIEHARSKFYVSNREPIEVRCSYCERKYKADELKFNIK